VGPKTGLQKCGKLTLTGIRSPDRPVRSESNESNFLKLIREYIFGGTLMPYVFGLPVEAIHMWTLMYGERMMGR
jgi:cyclopropane fatty-acyl-phospholipid synthase-like methyltransferase